MEKITTSAELKKAIQLLEVEQYVSGQQLKEQLFTAYESFKTVNLFKNTLKDVVTSPFVIDNLLATGISMATGYLSSKILVGVSGKIARKLLGTVLQFGIKRAANPLQSVKSIGKNIVKHFLHKIKSISQP
jgi:hypothetical protein